ncbi:MAG: galactose-1-phosphate uridylyltransferase, partial [Lachnospiraceae bacterium]|nr:galactose-1-phosphate uridylyltransferase [Lachnospiraceae bacterium]
IKKENIGLIEVMGLAVLPSRLKKEMEDLAPLLVAGDFDAIRKDEVLAAHADWAEGFAKNYSITSSNVEEILKQEIGKVFCQVLEDAGVYKWNEEGLASFRKFIASL